MFNGKRIQNLEWRYECTKENYERLRSEYWSLRHDMDAIARHLGVKFEDVNKRVLVKTGTAPTPHDPDLTGAD